MYAARNHRTRNKRTYQLLHPKKPLPLLRQRNIHDRNLPAHLTPIHLDIQSTANNLMSKANPNHPHTVLREDLLRKLDEFQDPRVVVESVIFCFHPDPRACASVIS